MDYRYPSTSNSDGLRPTDVRLRLSSHTTPAMSQLGLDSENGLFLEDEEDYGAETTVILVDQSRIASSGTYDFDMPVFPSDIVSLHFNTEPYISPVLAGLDTEQTFNGGYQQVTDGSEPFVLLNAGKPAPIFEGFLTSFCRSLRSMLPLSLPFLSSGRSHHVSETPSSSSSTPSNSSLAVTSLPDRPVSRASTSNGSNSGTNTSTIVLPPIFIGSPDSENTYLLHPKSAAMSSIKPSRSSTVDSGHHHLLPSISTTSRFTHKWPRPSTVRHLSVLADSPVKRDDSTALATAVEDGKGLGFERLKRWSRFKWCLMVSVCMVLVLGGLIFITALLTWFGGKTILHPVVLS